MGKRLVRITVALALIVGVGGIVINQATADTSLATVAADTFTASDSVNTNYGASTLVSMDASPLKYGFFKFNVIVPTDRIVTSATFSCWAGSANSSGASVYSVPSTWTETGLTWANQPALGTLLGSTGAVSAGVYTKPVPVSVSGSGTYSFATKTASSTQWSCYSKESSHKAILDIVTIQKPARHVNTALPARGSFSYPWFPEAWDQSGINPATHYNPTLGFYSSTAVLAQQVQAKLYGGFKFDVSSWWGQGTKEDVRFQPSLDAAHGTVLQIAPYYEAEGNGPNPSVAQITSDLNYLAKYVNDPNYMYVNDKPVIFVYGDGTDNCTMVDRWAQANAAATVHFYTVLKVFGGYTACANQPNNWHQYGPASPTDSQGSYSYSISPGFWHFAETTPRLARDLARFKTNVQSMNCSNASLQLVTTFNEWGEGSSVESATEWSSVSGYGQYLDALHNDLACGAPTTPPPTTTPPGPGTVIAIAGDISCEMALPLGTSSCAQDKTATLVESINPVAVLTAGDNQYNAGQLVEYNGSYDKYWGRFKAKTYPVPGNHEWGTPNAQGYKDYFGKTVNWYSYDLGGWHFLALDSDCGSVGGCAVGNPEYTFIQNDLAANNGKPTLAYWHHPRYSSGDHGDNTSMSAIWNLLYGDRDVQLVINGHDHNYERLARMGTSAPDPVGIKEFVVGTGGKSHYCTNTNRAGQEAYSCASYGVLKLTLQSTGAFDYQFLPATGTFTDSGTVPAR